MDAKLQPVTHFRELDLNSRWQLKLTIYCNCNIQLISKAPLEAATAVPWALAAVTATLFWLAESSLVTALRRAICYLNKGKCRHKLL